MVTGACCFISQYHVLRDQFSVQLAAFVFRHRSSVTWTTTVATIPMNRTPAVSNQYIYH